MADTKKLPLHSTLPKNMTWDLAPMYASKTAWEKDFSSLDGLLKKAVAFKGRLGEGPKVLAAAFAAIDELERVGEKTYTFAHLRSDEDTSVSANRALVARAGAKFAQIGGDLAWFEPELLALPDAQLKKYLNSKELAFYRRTLEETLRDKPHTLSAPEERLLGMASDIFGSSEKIFSTLNDADLTFPVVKDEQGKRQALTHGNYIKYLESPDRKVRKNAFTALYKTYEQFRNTFATTLYGDVKTHVYSAKIRHYSSALTASLHDDNVPEAVYNNLIDTVHRHLPQLFKYFGLRAKTLGLKQLDMYDIHCPLVPEYRLEVSWEQACEWVQAALAPLGKDYCTKLKQAFEKRWIDVLECKGKRSGAYSSGCFDSNPYLLLNYTNTLDEVFTLAHELGHSMHSWYSNHTQDYHYADYSIFVAEIASTTNELLLHDYLLKHGPQDRNFRLYLLSHHADQFRGTIYRQTMFAEFEKMIHEKVEQDVPLTADELCKAYFELNRAYHAENVKPDQLIELEWARIPHFYYDFYVYKYATGLSAAAQLSQNILSGNPKKLNAYLGFLKAGCTKDVLDIMKDAGVDLSTPAPVDAALNRFGDTVDELAALLKKGKK